MNKNVTFAPDAQKELVKGINILADAVKATIGPKGRKVIIETAYGTPHATKDGVTVANAINLAESVPNMGAQIIKQAAAKTLEQCGDGTTNATVLAQAIVNKGFKYLESGINPTLLTLGMKDASNKVGEFLRVNSREVDGDWGTIANVATVSANNDVWMGDTIAEALKLVGKDGVVLVQESKSVDTYITEVSGIKFDRSYISPYFVNNPAKQTVEFEDPFILIYDKKIRAASEIVPLLEQVASKSRPLLIIADDVESQALSLLVINKMRGNLNVAAIKAPGFGDRRQKLLEDLAVATGATLISESSGRTISSATIKDLGSAAKVVIDKQNTTVVEAKGDAEKIAARVEEIRSELDVSATGWEKEKNKERLAQLGAKMAILHVGATTEVELKEKKDRIDDALHATQAAMAYGIVEGGGFALARAAEYLKDVVGFSTNSDVALGQKIIIESIIAPAQAILLNGGLSPDIIIDRCLKEKIGYNSATDTYVDLFKEGIVDPLTVPTTALQAAVSVASLILSSNVVLTNDLTTAQSSNSDIDTSRLMDF